MFNLQSLEQRMDKIDYQVVSDDKDKQIADLEAKLLKTQQMKISEIKQGSGSLLTAYKTIKSLEAKLAESEERAERYKNWYNESTGENAELKQQLTEKEKEIETIRDTHIYRFYLNEDKVQDVYMTDVMLKVFNQDKISFCIEQLELLKQKMANFDFPNNPKLYNNDMFCDGFDSHYRKTKEEIDNQIEELKKGVE